MRVIVVPHEPLWAKKFTQEASHLHEALGTAAVAIHHIGSTAIVGIYAKPIIDILIAATNLDSIDERTPRLESLGYESLYECGIPGRRYFRKNNATGERTHQIHAFAADSPQIERHLAFRDFMLAHPEHAARYEALKRELAARFPDNIDAYCTGKDEFIQEIDARAKAWRNRDAAEP